MIMSLSDEAEFRPDTARVAASEPLEEMGEGCSAVPRQRTIFLVQRPVRTCLTDTNSKP